MRQRRITFSLILAEALEWKRRFGTDMPIDKREVLCILGQKLFVVEDNTPNGFCWTLRFFCQGCGLVHCHLKPWWQELLPPNDRINRW